MSSVPREGLPPAGTSAQLAPAAWWRRPLKPFHSRFARQLAIVSVLLGGIAAAGHFIGGMIGWWHLYEVTFLGHAPAAGTAATKTTTAPPLSIVVLPLATEGGNQEGDWFTDVLSADLTTALGSMSGSIVISRDTAAAYKGKTVDPRQVSRDLGVRYVVRGTARRDGDKVRLSLAMVDGETGAQHWAQQFDMERSTMQTSLQEVVMQVGRSLSVQLYRSAGKRVSGLKPEQVQADDLAMQGWDLWLRGPTRQNILEANKLFEAAVARDPHSIRGWGGISVVANFGANTGFMPDREAALRRAREAVRRMQDLDSDDFFAVQGRVLASMMDRDYESVLAGATELIERFPNIPHGYSHRAYALMSVGRFEECIEAPKRAIRIGPRDSMLGLWNLQIGTCHFMRGEYTPASVYARAAARLLPDFPLPSLTLAASLARDGQVDEGRKIVAEFRQRSPNYTIAFIGKNFTMQSKVPAFMEGRQRLEDSLRELGMQ